MGKIITNNHNLNSNKNEFEKNKRLIETFEKVVEDVKKLEPDKQKEFLNETLSAGGLTKEAIKEVASSIKNGLPFDTIVKNLVADSASLNIRLIAEKNNTTIPAGFNVLDELIPIVSYQNGNVTIDYEDYIDGASELVGLYAPTQDEMLDAWKNRPIRVAQESWKAEVAYHGQTSIYVAGLSAAHKNATMFALMFNNLTQKLGQALSKFWLMYRARAVWKGELVDTSFKNVTAGENRIASLDPVSKNADDKTIEVFNGSGNALISEINTLMKSFETPSRNHLLGLTKKELEIPWNDGSKEDLERSLDLENVVVVVPVELAQALRQGTLAASLNAVNPEFLTTFEKNMKVLSYNVFENYGKITDLKHDIHVNEQGKIEGEATILIMSKGLYKIIHQFDYQDTFDTGLGRQVINYWSYFGLEVDKSVKHFKMQIGLKVNAGASTPPTTLKFDKINELVDKIIEG